MAHVVTDFTPPAWWEEYACFKVVDITNDANQNTPTDEKMRLSKNEHLLLIYSENGYCKIVSAQLEKGTWSVSAHRSHYCKGVSLEDLKADIGWGTHPALQGWTTGGLKAAKVAQLMYENQPTEWRS